MINLILNFIYIPLMFLLNVKVCICNLFLISIFKNNGYHLMSKILNQGSANFLVTRPEKYNKYYIHVYFFFISNANLKHT